MTGPTASPEPPRSPERSRRPWHLGDPRLTKLIVAGVVLLYGIIFIVLNRDKVRTHFVFFTVTSRLWVGFLVCVVLGVLLGYGVGIYRRRRTAGRDRTDGHGGAPQ
jgi:uncharacterized integral membrane protein